MWASVALCGCLYKFTVQIYLIDIFVGLGWYFCCTLKLCQVVVGEKRTDKHRVKQWKQQWEHEWDLHSEKLHGFKHFLTLWLNTGWTGIVSVPKLKRCGKLYTWLDVLILWMFGVGLLLLRTIMSVCTFMSRNVRLRTTMAINVF